MSHNLSAFTAAQRGVRSLPELKRGILRFKARAVASRNDSSDPAFGNSTCHLYCRRFEDPSGEGLSSSWTGATRSLLLIDKLCHLRPPQVCCVRAVSSSGQSLCNVLGTWPATRGLSAGIESPKRAQRQDITCISEWWREDVTAWRRRIAGDHNVPVIWLVLQEWSMHILHSANTSAVLAHHRNQSQMWAPLGRRILKYPATWTTNHLPLPSPILRTDTFSFSFTRCWKSWEKRKTTHPGRTSQFHSQIQLPS